MKYTRKLAARQCEIHSKIYYMAFDFLCDQDFYSEDKIVEKLELKIFQNAIRWDYIGEFLKEDMGEDLIPIVASFFKEIEKDKEKAIIQFNKDPGKYIAVGNGKKTKGYARICSKTGALAEHRMNHKKEQAITMATQALAIKTIGSIGDHNVVNLQIENDEIKKHGSM